MTVTTSITASSHRKYRRSPSAGRALTRCRSRCGRLLVILAGCLCMPAGAADQFELIRSTVDGGGTMFCTGGDFELSGTIGQPDAGTMEGGEFELAAGFWFGASPGDCNTDGLTDLVDYDSFNRCISGPGETPRMGCTCYDLDGDDDVDLSDVAGFQGNFFGG